MEFDIKNNLLKTSVGENRLGQKNIKATIDDSLVTQMAQKGLDMNLDNEAASLKKDRENQKNKQNNKKKNTGSAASLKNEEYDKDQKKIVRDPLVLLKLF